MISLNGYFGSFDYVPSTLKLMGNFEVWCTLSILASNNVRNYFPLVLQDLALYKYS